MRQKILEVQLWHIDGDAFIAQEWSHKFSYSKPNLEAISIWVRFNNVPCDLITERGLFHIGGALGYPVVVKNLHGFSSGEVQVKVNLSQPLPNLVEVETDEEDIITLEVSYLKLPPICPKCRIIGHRDSACTMLIHSPSAKVQETIAGSVLLNRETQAEVTATATLIANPQKIGPTPQVISNIVSPDTTILKTATVLETLQTPSISPKEITIIAAVIPSVAKAAIEQNSYAKVVATPDRISSPSFVQVECADTVITTPTSANAVVTPPFSSPMSDKPPPCDDISYHSPVKPVMTSTFGNLFDKNGVFIGDDWNVSTQKFCGGRHLKPSQKKQEMQWSQSRGCRSRGGHRN
uniref:Uncharacterized protein n=1 Tax=Noccaea caerulescens TaxID=107243 RepID=A0A1J3IMR4_NOCCA